MLRELYQKLTTTVLNDFNGSDNEEAFRTWVYPASYPDDTRDTRSESRSFVNRGREINVMHTAGPRTDFPEVRLGHIGAGKQICRRLEALLDKGRGELPAVGGRQQCLCRHGGKIVS